MLWQYGVHRHCYSTNEYKAAISGTNDAANNLANFEEPETANNNHLSMKKQYTKLSENFTVNGGILQEANPKQ